MNPSDMTDKQLKAEIEELQGYVDYLNTEEAEAEYVQKAKDLLATLFDKWSELASYIETQQTIAREDNVVFGPHGRPRHIWGYYHPDRFVQYAMDRRVFNSLSQGFASDIGYVAIFLVYKTLFEFKQRGFDLDFKQANAVHDSAKSDIPFPVLPLAIYIQEHAMISMSADYYYEHFGIWPKAMYGCDVEAGPHEADMTEYNKRPRDLAAFVQVIGEKCNIPQRIIDSTKEDCKVLAKLRLNELRETNHKPSPKTADMSLILSDKSGKRLNPDREQWFNQIVPDLNMWKTLDTEYEVDPQDGVLVLTEGKV